MNLVNASQLSKIIGISAVAVCKAARVGRLTKYEQDGKTLFDADTAASELQANSQPGKKRDHKLGGRPPKDGSKPAVKVVASKPEPAPKPTQRREDQSPEIGSAPSDSPSTYNEAARLEKFYKAQLAKLEFEQAIGQVVSIDEVAKTVEVEYSRVRARLLGIAAKLAPDVALADDEAKCRAIIDAAIVDALKELTADATIQQKAAA